MIRNCFVLANSLWEMFPRAIDSCWALLKGYRRAAGKCPNTRLQPIGEKVELPSGYWQQRGTFYPFYLKRRVSVYIA
jgi:hypothetical protein